MKIRHFPHLLVPVLTAFLAPFSSGSAEPSPAPAVYEVLFHRPVRPGLKYQWTGEGNWRQTTTLKGDGATLKRDERRISVELDTDAEVLEAEAGFSKREQHKVVHAKLTKDGVPVPGVEKDGGIVLVASGEGTVIGVEGKPAEGDLLEVLKLALPDLASAGPAGLTPGLFASPKKVRKGERWKIRAEALAGQLEKLLPGAKAEDPEGWMRLEDIVDYEATECFQVKGELTFGRFTFPLPDGFVMERGSLKAEIKGLIPARPDGKDAETTLRVVFEGSANAPEGSPNAGMTLEFKSERETTAMTTVVE